MSPEENGAMVTTPASIETQLISHLLRRAGFGGTRDEIDRFSKLGYEATVEHLLNPPSVESMPQDIIRRYHVDQSDLRVQPATGANWIYRMVTTNAPLLEKIALLWHRVFATGQTKLIQGKVIVTQLEMFRRLGLGNYRDLLLALSRDPAMLMWLDNQDNHNGAINENFGREILELFSMGVGNYTEHDIYECSRAFTGWTIANTPYNTQKMRNNTARPYGYIAWQFKYDDSDHDHGEKTFLGKTGDLNGEEIVDIICEQRATARFIARHLYHHFVADEVPVPQWPHVPPKDPEAIELMADAYFSSGYSIGEMLRATFNSGFFKSEATRNARIKSPVEVVVGSLRLSGGYEWPTMDVYDASASCGYMGQGLLAPPSVEGWQGGEEWVSTGAMMQRVNYASRIIGDPSRPGVREIIDAVCRSGASRDAETLVDECLRHLGYLELGVETQREIVEFARGQVAQLPQGGVKQRDEAVERAVIAVLQLAVATREFQLA
ncbi:MAG: DUF1800 domain-containing protein [Chloroflexi bacterium]|nr:DUF1800 domain-containing protein [Chloroflexota bacterium]